MWKRHLQIKYFKDVISLYRHVADVNRGMGVDDYDIK